MSAIVCGQDGVQRRVVKQGRWWLVLLNSDPRECLSGGFSTEAAAKREARRLGEVEESSDDR